MKKTLSPKVTRSLLAVTSVLLVLVLAVQCLYTAGVFRRQDVPADSPVQEVPGPTEILSREGCRLEQVVILSRHNIRSPLSGTGSALDRITPHE